MLESFNDLFTAPFSEQHLDVKPFKIDLVEGAQLRRAYPRSLATEIQKKVDEEIARLVELGIVRKSNSFMCSPIVVARKPDGSIRLCVDFRELNLWTIRLRFPLPHTQSIIGRLHGNKYFAKLDLTMGYHQWLVDPQSIPYTAFVTANGLYEFTRVPFGCCNAPNGFQQLMKEILGGLEGQICEVYLDDVLIPARSEEELLERTRSVLERFRQYKVLVKPSKCKFGFRELEFLGHIINDKTISLAPKRVQNVLDMATPKSIKQVRTFLGLANAFRDYIPGYSMKQSKLSKLTGKENGINKKFEWKEEHTECFESIKADIAKSPERFHITYQDPLVLVVDASDDGVGGVLIQLRNGVREPILFLSHVFSPVARRWATIEQEAYAIYFCIMECEDLLACHPFTLMTDHKNLLYIYEATAPKIIRWRLRLQMFEFDLIHIPGRDNVIADALSRLLTL